MKENFFERDMNPLGKSEEGNHSNSILKKVLLHGRKGQFLYPGIFSREEKIDIRMAYETMESCVESGILKQYLQIQCPFCHSFTGECHESVFDLPKEHICMHCGKEIPIPATYAAIIYQVQ